MAHDPEGLILIPERINDVRLEFAPGVNRMVKKSLVDLLDAAINPRIAEPFILQSLWISSAADRHILPSRHAMRRAIDISRINGKKMSIHFPSDPEVRSITDALIRRFRICGPTFVAREIFGPGMNPGGVKLKLGLRWPGVKDHMDHIHLSEGDRLAIDGCPWDTMVA